MKNALAFFVFLLALVAGIGINPALAQRHFAPPAEEAVTVTLDDDNGTTVDDNSSAEVPSFPTDVAGDHSPAAQQCDAGETCLDMCLSGAFGLKFCCGPDGPGYHGVYTRGKRKDKPNTSICKWYNSPRKAKTTTGKDGRGIDDLKIESSSGHLIVTYTDGKVQDLGKVVGADGVDGRNGTSGSSGLGIVTFDIDKDGHLVVLLTDGSKRDLGRVVGRDGSSNAQLVPYLSFSFGSGRGDAVVGLGIGLELRIGKFTSMVEVVGYDAPKADMLQRWRGQISVKLGASLSEDLDLLGVISFVQESWDPLGGWSQRSALVGADLEYRLNPYVALTFQTLFGLFYSPQQDLGSADATLWVLLGVKGRLP